MTTQITYTDRDELLAMQAEEREASEIELLRKQISEAVAQLEDTSRQLETIQRSLAGM
jgi:hypothetical protein